MYKKVILITLLITALLIAIKNTDAAEVDEYLRSTLPTFRTVTTSGGNISTTIDCDTGNLAADLTPQFWFATNQPGQGVTNWSMSATVLDSTMTQQNAMYGPDGSPSIILANTTVGERPTLAAINDIKNGILASNANAIAYPMFSTLLLGSGTLDVIDNTFLTPQNYFDLRTRGRGFRYITLGIQTTARASTYTSLDSPGAYQAVVTFQYGTP